MCFYQWRIQELSDGGRRFKKKLTHITERAGNIKRTILKFKASNGAFWSILPNMVVFCFVFGTLSGGGGVGSATVYLHVTMVADPNR